MRKKETETKREKKTNKIGRKRRIKDVTGDIKRKGEYNEEKKEQDKKYCAPRQAQGETPQQHWNGR